MLRTHSALQPTCLVNLLHFFDIRRTLRSFVYKQCFVPKTKLNIGKCAFSEATPTFSNQLPITIQTFEILATSRKISGHIYLKLLSTTNVQLLSVPFYDLCCSSELDLSRIQALMKCYNYYKFTRVFPFQTMVSMCQC